ncbi:36649_t:CDS:2 [Racocetra persica]|uniref:36649_t:CDS:1 n=1 Tax=Racocetra persica TaxID=160502 RepID=A0ACA9RNS5_9GLOM|nr:36649_t:CDS:2 [Racocetra persica]
MKNISKVKRVIIFGLDGIGRFFQQANTPTIDNFLASGASTLKARAIFPTDSAENWSSILTGVKPEKNKHRLKHEELETGDSYPENSSFPSLFKLIATEFPGAKMASFAVPVHRYAPLINESETRQKELDKHYQDKSSIYDKDVVTRVVEYIKNDENKDTKLLFIHFTDADEHGHHWGYGTSQHLEQIKTMDSQIDRILETVEQVG